MDKTLSTRKVTYRGKLRDSRILSTSDLEKLLYDAYLAGWNKDMAGFWRHPSTQEKTGEPHTLAQMWAKKYVQYDH